MKDFLPQGYEPPKAETGYMSLEEGQNKIWILDSALIGWEYWNVDNKPVRMPDSPEDIPADIRRNEDGEPERIKHFWAFPVWNTKEERVQILEITQKTIQRAITALVNNEEWGSPVQHYPITITREGEKLDTTYNVTPSPVREMPDEILEEWERVQERGFDLSRLYEGGNPFSPDGE